MTAKIKAAYMCRPCEIEGQDEEQAGVTVTCWNCGGPVVVTARITPNDSSPQWSWL